MFAKSTDLDSVGIISAIADAGNRMGTARRCNLARLFLILLVWPGKMYELVVPNPEGVQILIRVSDSVLFH